MELPTLGTDELAKSQTTLDAQSAMPLLSPWEITAVVVAGLVASYGAFTIWRFVHERNLIRKQRFYLQVIIASFQTPGHTVTTQIYNRVGACGVHQHCLPGQFQLAANTKASVEHGSPAKQRMGGGT
eukprot:scaffold316489_cov50-Prasinocladus_malaysianus.AAC.1